MSKTDSERLADEDYTAADYTRNDPHALPAATDPHTYGEYSWDEYSEAYQRAQKEQQERERWSLR